MTPDPGTMAPDPLREPLVLTVLTVNPLRERLHWLQQHPRVRYWIHVAAHAARGRSEQRATDVSKNIFCGYTLTWATSGLGSVTRPRIGSRGRWRSTHYIEDRVAIDHLEVVTLYKKVRSPTQTVIKRGVSMIPDGSIFISSKRCFIMVSLYFSPSRSRMR
jgi:hypothetical protein